MEASSTFGNINPNGWAVRLLDVVKSVRSNIHLTSKRAIIYILVLNITIISFMTMIHVAFGHFTFNDTCSISILCQIIGTWLSSIVYNLCNDFSRSLDNDINKLNAIIDKHQLPDRENANIINIILKDVTRYVRINLFIVLSYILMIIVCFASILITLTVI